MSVLAVCVMSDAPVVLLAAPAAAFMPGSVAGAGAGALMPVLGAEDMLPAFASGVAAGAIVVAGAVALESGAGEDGAVVV